MDEKNENKGKPVFTISGSAGPEQYYGTHINVKTKLYSTILLKMVSIKTKLLHAKNNMVFSIFSCLALHIFSRSYND